MLTEEYSDLIDRQALEREAERLDDPSELLNFVRSIGHSSSEAASWGVEDVGFWETGIYGDDRRVAATEERIARSRPNAGLRTFPRERHIFRHLRPHLKGGKLLDIGCGTAQTIQVLCDPESVGYTYVGVDLSLSALSTNQVASSSQLVQASATALPFQCESFDAVVSLGTMHHLYKPTDALQRVLTLLKPGGFIGLHEVTYRGSRSQGESAHNDAVSLPDVLNVIKAECEIIDLKLEHTFVRHLLAARLAEPMRTSPMLTRIVCAVDSLGAPLGALHPKLGPHAVLITARKRPPSRPGESTCSALAEGGPRVPRRK